MRLLALIVLMIVGGVSAPWAHAAGRCATGLRGAKPGRFDAVRPLPRQGAYRLEEAPVPFRNGTAALTDHFRLIWGNVYPATDPDWADADGNGRPDWVDAAGEAFEQAYQRFVGLGLPSPYGAGTYYLDVYFANTGLQVYSSEVGRFVDVTVSSDYYAYTEIDTDYGVAYFVVNDDFSPHSDDEQAVLQATAAHELFHAVQRALGYPWDDEVQVPDRRWRDELWWFESTATWMEEVVAPDVDDYVTYVRRFLAAPEEPLGGTDGLREYGASIFAGYLWLRHGAQDLWIDVFSHAFADGLEPALRAALRARGAPALEDVVAAFWSLAAHPEDLWPDGTLYHTSSAPRLSREADGLPLAYTSSPYSAPGRWGANLFRIESVPGSMSVELSTPVPAAARVAVSHQGSAEVTVLESPTEGTPSVVDTGRESAPVYVAVVNAAGSSTELDYTLDMGAAGLPGGSQGGDWERTDGGSGGGCFVNTLSRR